MDRLSRHLSSEPDLRSSVDQVNSLALEGNHLCRLIARHGGVRSGELIFFQFHLLIKFEKKTCATCKEIIGVPGDSPFRLAAALNEVKRGIFVMFFLPNALFHKLIQ